MLAAKCDRCGKFYDLNGQFTVAVERFTENITTHQQKNGNHIELCPDCDNEFREWIKSGAETETPPDNIENGVEDGEISE